MTGLPGSFDLPDMFELLEILLFPAVFWVILNYLVSYSSSRNGLIWLSEKIFLKKFYGLNVSDALVENREVRLVNILSKW